MRDALYYEFREIVNSETRASLKFRQNCGERKRKAEEKNHSLNVSSADAEISRTGDGVCLKLCSPSNASESDLTPTFDKSISIEGIP